MELVACWFFAFETQIILIFYSVELIEKMNMKKIIMQHVSRIKNQQETTSMKIE